MLQEYIINYLLEIASDPRVVTLIIAMLPILELRGAIPWGYFIGGLTLLESVIYSIIGNFIILIPIYIFFKNFTEILRRYSYTDRFITWLFSRTQRRGKIIQRKKFLGLVLFVGIPLPITGAWTGILAAYIFGLSIKKSLLSILLGLILSAIIVSILISMGLLIF